MNIDVETKKKLIKEYGSSEKDTGKTEVQIAILSHEIKELTEHMKKNKKDLHSKSGLYAKVSKRASLLKYLKNKDVERYTKLISQLNLRK